jgi:hypothetical protein
MGVKDRSKPNTVRALGVDLPVGQAWFIFLLFTVAHFYSAYVFRDDVHKCLLQDVGVRMDAWQSLTGSSLLFFHRLFRHPEGFIPTDSRGDVLLNPPTGPSIWLIYGMPILLFTAIVRYREASWLTRIGTTLIALCVAYANLQISGWAFVAASALGAIAPTN